MNKTQVLESILKRTSQNRFLIIVLLLVIHLNGISQINIADHLSLTSGIPEVGNDYFHEIFKKKPIELDSTESRFIDMSDKLMFNFRLIMKSYSMEVRHVDSDSELGILPSGQVNLGVGFNYKWFGLAVNWGIPPSSEAIEKYGETTRQDLYIGLYGNRIGGLVSLQRYRGFYISNYQDSISGDHLKLPSLETVSLSISGLYFFNHKKLSYKAAYVRNAIQTKSAGSFVAGGYLTYDISNADLSIGNSLPDSIAPRFDITGVWSRTMGVSFGYSYSWVFAEDFFINGTVVPGIGVKKIELSTSKSTIVLEDGLAARFEVNFAFGYESEKWLAGLSVINSSKIYEIEGLVITPRSTSVKLFVAKRFNFLEKKKATKR